MIAIEFLCAASGDGASVLQPILDWFGIEDAFRRWLVALGFLGQVVFFSRWIIQWMASERRGESHMPEFFWWCSLVGAGLLLTYFILDRDPVGILGQSVGWMVYSRNIYLIHFKHRKPVEEPAPGPDAED